MPDENLLSYIKNSEAQGRSEDIIRSMLFSAGWQQKEIDEAFVVLKGLGTQAQNETQPAQPSQPAQIQPTQPIRQLQSSTQLSPAPHNKKKGIFWGIAGIVLLIIIFVGAWTAYAFFMNPSPQQVLDAMLQKGIPAMISANNDMQLSLDLHVTPASGTPESLGTSGASAYAGALLGNTASEITLQTESSGTYARVSTTTTINADQNITVSFAIKRSGQSITFSGSAEVRLVDGVMYINLSSIPNLGFFDATPLEGKWIELPVTTSTESMAQNFIGQQSFSIPSTTISPADSQKIMSALEGIVTITNTLPTESIGGDPSYHYQYAVSEQGVKNAAATIISLTPGATANSASTTEEINSNIDDFFSAFTTIGGEIWIGKNNDYLHQISLMMAFSTSTSYGAINGTLSATSTATNINGDQIIVAPVGATDLQTLLQSAFSATSSNPSYAAVGITQENGRDARRISDLNEIQNALELYYNICGYYPGLAVPNSSCPSVNTQISTFSALSRALQGSNSLGISSVPNDPTSGATYYYGTNPSGSKYIIAARLENSQNSAFSYYTPPSLAGIKISGLVSCRAPMYCITL